MRALFLTLTAVLVVSLAALAQTASDPNPALNVQSMDRSADPCVDFYQYACGGWIKNNPIPADQSSWDVYGKMSEDNRAILRAILDRAAVPSPTRSANEQKIGDYYSSCMDTQAIELAADDPLQPELRKIGALESKSDLAAYLAAYHPSDIYIYFGESALFSFGSDQDAKDSSQYIPEADQGGLGLPDRDYYLKEDPKFAAIREAYIAHVTRMFELLGDEPDVAAANAGTVMRIETALAKASMDRVARRDPENTYHKMSRAEFVALSPSFAWDKYFAGMGMPNMASLNVVAPDFFKGMDQVLQAEDLASWKTYLRWHLVHAQARYLSSPFVNADFDFYSRILTGATEIQPRWKRCVRYVDRGLGETLGQAYVAEHFTPQDKARTLKMVQGIEAAMASDIQQLPWMSEVTKVQALAKLHAVVNKIGYPDRWRDYSALTIKPGDFLGNGERATEFEFFRQLRKIGKPVDRGEWYMSPPTVNAYYSPQMNDINFPAGILQPPVFDPQSDDAPNYGDTGATIGHELTHGFDDEGRKYDGQGNLRDWWTKVDAEEFQKRAACISDQYAQYTVVDNIKINSKLTLGEDVADLGGLILSYMAWKHADSNQDPQPIDGFTPDQRFFIGYAQSWCGSERPEVLRMRATIDPHSPPKYRTNGVVSNMPEFQKAFACKPSQPMAPENRCRVW